MRVYNKLAVACVIVVASAGVIAAETNPVGRDGDGSPTARSRQPMPGNRFAQSNSSTVEPAVDAPEATSGNPSQPPFKWVGLLAIPNPTKQDPNQIGMCTAEFIAPSVLLTAGHCLRDLPSNPAGPWPDATKGTFWLQYQNDSGTPFKIVCAEVNPLWALPSNYASMTPAQQQQAQLAAFQHDYAMILVDGTSPTGVMPYALDWKGKTSYALRVGYPADILDAAIVQAAPGYVFFANAIPMGTYSSTSLVVQWGPITDATNGMSGGAWVANYSATEGQNNNILIAVTSFSAVLGDGAALFPGGTFAAYLTATEFNPLLTSVANGCK